LTGKWKILFETTVQAIRSQVLQCSSTITKEKHQEHPPVIRPISYGHHSEVALFDWLSQYLQRKKNRNPSIPQASGLAADTGILFQNPVLLVQSVGLPTLTE
jgi:hypothetical protein